MVILFHVTMCVCACVPCELTFRGDSNKFFLSPAACRLFVCLFYTFDFFLLSLCQRMSLLIVKQIPPSTNQKLINSDMVYIILPRPYLQILTFLKIIILYCLVPYTVITHCFDYYSRDMLFTSFFHLLFI